MMDFWWVLAGRIIQLLTAFIALRFLSTLLGPEEVGRLAVIIAATTLFALVLVNPVGVYVNRRLHVWNESGVLIEKMLSYFLYVVAISCVAFGAVCLIPDVVDLQLPIKSLPLALLVAGSVNFNTFNQTLIPALNLLGHRKSWLILSTLSLWACLIISSFLATKSPSAEMWQTGQLIGMTIGALVAVPVFKGLTRKVESKKHVQDSASSILAFSLPVALTVGLNWTQFQSYRLFLGRWMPLTEFGQFMGVYVLVAGLMSALENFIHQFLHPRLYAESANESEELKVQAWVRYSSLAIPLLLFGGLGLLAAGTAFVHLILAPAFRSATSFILVCVIVETSRAVGSVYSMAGQITMRTRAFVLPQAIGTLVVIVSIPVVFAKSNLNSQPALTLALSLGALIYVSLSAWMASRRLNMRLPLRSLVPPLAALPIAFAFYLSFLNSELSTPKSIGLIAASSICLIPFTLYSIRNWRDLVSIEKLRGADELSVIQIVRAPIGSIRLHVLNLLSSNTAGETVRQTLVTSVEEADQAFKSWFQHSESNQRIISLSIPEQPSLKDFRNLFVLYRTLRRRKPKIIHGHGAKGGMYARLLSLALGAKAVYSPHGGVLHDVFSPAKKTLFLLVEKALAPFTDALVFESDYSRRRYFELVRDMRSRSFFIPNGINLAELSSLQSLERTLETQSNRPKIGAFGMLRHLKGHDILVRAAAILRSRELEFDVEIFGAGPEHQSLQSLINQLKLSDRVKLMGETDQPLLRMRECALIVQPSRFESFGYTAVEAMALGKPVVAFAVGGLREVIRDEVDGLLVNVLEPQALAHAIERILANPDLAYRLGSAAAVAVSQQFDASVMTAQIHDLYRSLAGKIEKPN